MTRRPPRSTLFPTRRSSDLLERYDAEEVGVDEVEAARELDRRFDLLGRLAGEAEHEEPDRKSTRLNSSHEWISYAVFCLKKKKKVEIDTDIIDQAIGDWRPV